MPNENVTSLIQTFAHEIIAATKAAASQRIQAALASVFGTPAKRRPGRPPKPAQGTAAAVPATKSARKRKAPKATAKLIRARKVQGQYLGALKSLGAADKAKVKAVAKDKGVAAGLKLAASLKRAMN